MLNDAIKGFYEATKRYNNAPENTIEETDAWWDKYDAEQLIMQNARSYCEGRRIITHVRFLASRKKWPLANGVKEIQVNISLQGQYNMVEL